MKTIAVSRPWADSKFIAATLMVLGTSVGAGMLGLPVETGRAGLFPSLFTFLITWLIMIGSGMLFSDLLIARRPGTNFISVTQEILGPRFVALTFGFYLLLFYSLTTAYIKGIGTLLALPLPIAPWQGSLVFIALFIPLMYSGTKTMGRVNNALTLLLVIAFVLLLSTTLPHLNTDYLAHQNWSQTLLPLPIVISSFAFHGTLPSLVDYLERDRAKIRGAIFIGLTLTLVVYILWELVVLGSVPLEGTESLSAAFSRDETAIGPMSRLFNNPFVTQSAHLFSLSAIVTSFFGVSIGLVDFLMDAFRLAHTRANKLKILLGVYLSAFLLSVTDTGIFYLSLTYGAGIACIFLLLFLPALMTHRSSPRPLAKAVLAFSLVALAVCVWRLGVH